MAKLIFLLTLLFGFSAKAEFINVLKNPNFESRTAQWVATGGAFAVSSTDPLEGTYSATWDPSATGQFVRSFSYTVPAGLVGGRCMVKMKYLWDSGVAGDILFNVDDGTNNIASLSLEPTAGAARFAVLNFDCPSSGSFRVELESTADAAVIKWDKNILGEADNSSSGKPQDVFSAYVADGSSTTTVSNENVDWINGNCTNGSAGVYVCTFVTNFFNGAVPNCQATGVTTAGGMRNAHIGSVSTSSVTVNVSNSTPAAADADFLLTCQNPASSASKESLTLETASASWTGYHDNTCSWARTNTAYGDPTADASCNLVQRTNTGFGTVTTSGSVLPAIVVSPKVFGKYWVCAYPKANLGAGNVGSLRIWDGTTVIAESEVTGVSSQRDTVPLCGILSMQSASVTISLQTASSSGAITIASSAVSSSAVEWSIIRIDQQFPMPVFTELLYSVKSPGQDTRLCSFKVNHAADTVSQVYPTGCVTGATNAGTGSSVVAFSGSYYSAAPNCPCSPEASNNRTCAIETVSTASVTVNASVSTTGALTDDDVFVTCTGPK